MRSDNPEYSSGEHDIGRLLRIRSVRQWFKENTSVQNSYLEIGSGNGLFTYAFIESSREKWGAKFVKGVCLDLVTPEDTGIDVLGPDFQFISADIDGNRLPFENESFDLIVCNHVLEHIFNTEFLLSEIYRVLKGDGILILSVPNLASWINRLLLLFASHPACAESGTDSVAYGAWPPFIKSRYKHHTPAGHIRSFTPRTLKDISESVGFKFMDWWNQDINPVFRITHWGGRGIGVILSKPIKQKDKNEGAE